MGRFAYLAPSGGIIGALLTRHRIGIPTVRASKPTFILEITVSYGAQCGQVTQTSAPWAVTSCSFGGAAISTPFLFRISFPSAFSPTTTSIVFFAQRYLSLGFLLELSSDPRHPDKPLIVREERSAFAYLQSIFVAWQDSSISVGAQTTRKANSRSIFNVA